MDWFSKAFIKSSLATGFVLRAEGASMGTVVLSVGGALSAAGAYIFVYVLWRTIEAPATKSPARAPLTRSTTQAR